MSIVQVTEVSFTEIKLTGGVIKCVGQKVKYSEESLGQPRRQPSKQFYGSRSQEKCGWRCRQESHLNNGSY